MGLSRMVFDRRQLLGPLPADQQAQICLLGEAGFLYMPLQLPPLPFVETEGDFSIAFEHRASLESKYNDSYTFFT